MQIFGMIAFIILMAISVGLFAIVVYQTRGIVKRVTKVLYLVGELKTILYLILGLTLSFTLAIGSIYFWAQITPKWYEALVGLLCSALFICSISSFYVSFRLHYYRLDIEKNIDKILYRIMLCSIPVFIISLWYSFNGFAAYMSYPIANGINIPHGITTPDKPASDGVTLAFYALSILSGALFVYFLCDHKMYQQYGRHGTLESTFLVAFPSGILGARIWYVIGNWNKEFSGQPFWHVFAIWEGGLTILGGAIMGIVVGVLWYIWRNKHYSIWVAVDMIVPTILLAQAIGRLGNFFNCEVHGNPVPISSWSFLPQIILHNGMYSSTDVALTDGTFYLPLFLIEGIINVGGYFVLAELFGKKLRKFTELGDLAFGYVLVYGIVRAFLEPLRNANYNMGENGYWSWVFSCLFIVFGALGIFGNHLVRFLIRRKKGEVKPVNNLFKKSLYSLIGIGAVALVFITLAIVFMAGKQPNLSELVYDLFNVGVMFLCLGGGALLFAGCSLIYIFETKPKKEVINA